MAFQAHEIRYLRKEQRSTPKPVVNIPSPNTINGLVGMDLITETPAVSISVKLGGLKVAHFVLEDITNWDLQSTTLFIYTNDTEFWTLTFINPIEAQLGLDRLEIAMNGGTI